MERFGWTERELYEENTIGFYNQVIIEMNLRGQAEKQRQQEEEAKANARAQVLTRSSRRRR